LNARTFEWLLGFAIGAAWVAAIGGAYLAFDYAAPYGVSAAVCAAVLGLIPGFVVVVALEGAKKLFEIASESKKQTALLEEIANYLKSK
jgi:hypothetical protein